jgi:Ca2+-binding EF-hand superfamily protein
MEDNANQYPFSNIALVNAKVRTRKEVVQRLFLTYPALTSRMLDVPELMEILVNKAGLDLVKQEVCTLYRAVDTQREGTIKMTRMLKYIMDL